MRAFATTLVFGLCLGAGIAAIAQDVKDPCAKTCSREGRCTWDADAKVCVAASDDDCNAGNACNIDGLCFAEGGNCVASGESCAHSMGCEANGLCTVKDGACQLTSTADCAQSRLCTIDGRCLLSEGSCVVTDAGCRKAEACGEFGACSAPSAEKARDQCLATLTKDCRASQVCQDGGACSVDLEKGECVAASSADCQASELCTRDGRCSWKEGSCVVASDADCQRSEGCAKYGECGLVEGVCKATRVAQCQASQVCAFFGECSLWKGNCIVTDQAQCKRAEVCSKHKQCKLTPSNDPKKLYKNSCLSKNSNIMMMALISKLSPSSRRLQFSDIFDASSSFSAKMDAFTGSEPMGFGLGGVRRRAAIRSRCGAQPKERTTLNNLKCPVGTQRHLETSKVSGKALGVWCKDANGKKHGPALRQAPYGRATLTHFKNGVKDGSFRSLNSGDVTVKGQYKQGKAAGYWCTWRDNGAPLSEGSYTDGRKSGVWLEWSRDGEPAQCDFSDPNTPESECRPPK